MGPGQGLLVEGKPLTVVHLDDGFDSHLLEKGEVFRLGLSRQKDLPKAVHIVDRADLRLLQFGWARGFGGGLRFRRMRAASQ